MLEDPIRTALLAALAIALLVAAFTDLKSRKIGNWLTGTVALTAPLFWWASDLAIWPDVAIQLGLGIATFFTLSILFALKLMGGGDIKLLTALALWMKPMVFLDLILLMALIGGVLTLFFAAWHLAKGQRDKLAIPYGLAIAMAGLLVIGMNYFPASAVTATA